MTSCPSHPIPVLNRLSPSLTYRLQPPVHSQGQFNLTTASLPWAQSLPQPTNTPPSRPILYQLPPSTPSSSPTSLHRDLIRDTGHHHHLRTNLSKTLGLPVPPNCLTQPRHLLRTAASLLGDRHTHTHTVSSFQSLCVAQCLSCSYPAPCLTRPEPAHFTSISYPLSRLVASYISLT